MYKKPGESYTIDDLIMDESFVNYHLHSNRADELFWKEWIASHPEKKALVKKAEELIATLSITISEAEYQEELSKITEAINKPGNKTEMTLLNWNRRPFFAERRRLVRYLVPVFLVLIFAGYFLMNYFKNTGGELSQTSNAGSNPLMLTLSDSTVVTLAPHSILRYPAQFNIKQRNVYLEGDAGFYVKRNEQAPFKVYVENMVTTVLGTGFNIKKSGDSALMVDLLKGKLKVEINNKTGSPEPIMLTPGESAIYVRNSQHFYKTVFVPRFSFSFHQNDFGEVAAQIKNVFGVTLINQSIKKHWRFTGNFKNRSANEIIEYISEVERLSFSVSGDTILIK